MSDTIKKAEAPDTIELAREAMGGICKVYLPPQAAWKPVSAALDLASHLQSENQALRQRVEVLEGALKYIRDISTDPLPLGDDPYKQILQWAQDRARSALELGNG